MKDFLYISINYYEQHVLLYGYDYPSIFTIICAVMKVILSIYKSCMISINFSKDLSYMHKSKDMFMKERYERFFK